MKKILIIFFIFTYYSFSHFPISDENPILIGTNFGVNRNTINTNKDTLTTESAFGYNVGLHYIYTLGDFKISRSSISVFLDFVSRNNRINDIQNNYLYDLTNNYLILKLNYDFVFYEKKDIKILVHSGPYNSYLLNSNIKPLNNIEIPKQNYNNFEIGVGFGFTVKKRLRRTSIGLDYNFMLGLTNTSKDYKDFRNNSNNLNLIWTLYIK